MKTLLLVAGILACIAATSISLTQSAEGIILYETTINVHRNLPEEKQAMKNMIPQFRVYQDALLFNANESLYQPIKPEPETDRDDKEGMSMRMRRPNIEVYINPSEYKRVVAQEIRAKRYLIEDTLSIKAWKLGSQIKELRGYVCKQATFYDAERKQTIVAWYSDKLRPFLGPENFNDLPGAVLQVDINDGERVITAKEIVFRLLEKDEMQVPTARNKITRTEYKRILQEEMERRRAHGGNMIIRN